MVEPHALAKLANAGNVKTVEEEWMKLLESPGVTPKKITAYAPALAGLVKSNNAEQAATLAWAAMETVTESHTPDETLRVAGPLLLAIGNHTEMRNRVTELYKSVYADRDGLEGLLKEAGIVSGRPVRRAVRTIDTCIDLQEGDYLVSRDEEEDEAALIKGIDRASWMFDITTQDGDEEIDAVRLADRFCKTAASDFRIKRHFFRDELQHQFDKEPGEVVIAVAKLHGGDVTRDQLEMALVPKFMTPADWKKWWTKARTALKKYSNVQIERKAPYTISYMDEGISPEDLHLANFTKTHDLNEQYGLVDAYIKECNARGEEKSAEILAECYNVFQRKADRLIKAASPEAGLAAVIARRVGELGGVDGAAKQATAVFQSSEDLEGLFCRIARDELHELACRTLEESRPESWTDEMLQLLPMFPLSGCERESRNLAKAGRSDFEAGVETVFANPVACYEALLWLWNGPDLGEEFPQKPLVTTLSRLLRMLDEVRRSDQMDRELVKRIAVRARTVIAARKYERFNSCLDQIETPMASALKTQINRLDNLGRAVREDLLKLMREKFPNLEVKPETPAWEREDVLFVTQAGYMRKQDEVEHHVNVKMKENARAIGAAAEHGDLSENSEYKFALEERDLLRARLAQMNGEMAIAQVLDPEQVPTDYVGIGTRVEFKRVTDGESYTMTLVGPWESDPDAGKFNYRAPLAQKVLGANVGEVVEFEHGNAEGQYEIVALHNGLIDSDDADADVSSEQQTTHQ